MRHLKKLNSDITHDTERENTIGINTGKGGPLARTKKSRNAADAREIEKELQDILDDMQRIPLVMCRPKVVIVFDELDKVEPGDAGAEKDIPQTKASLFSINATRERQTEILKILSNMKYFLSSAKAKFIFIAGREMFDIHLADVSERNNYIGSIFNVVILVPSFLTDHHTGKKTIPHESSIASLPEEFVCRRIIPHDYPVESYDLKNYRLYLENVVYKSLKDEVQKEEIVQKIIAVLQQFTIYLAHVSKGAPKKMIQLFESFVDIHVESGENKKNTLFVQRYHNSPHFLSFNYYKQYTLGIVAYLITPVFYRLAESNIKEHSDKLLVSSLRFVDFLFKFHKNTFSWKHLDMSPEMLEVNRAPELKSVVVDLLNYFSQVHINRSNFSLSEYKFDSSIANEIVAMAKTDEVFSALFSFSLDEMLPLKKHYQDMLEKTEKDYPKEKKDENRSSDFNDAISSLQGVLGDLHYYDDELEEAEVYYKGAAHAFRKNINMINSKEDGSKKDNKKKDANKDYSKIALEQLYAYVRNMLRLGIIYEKRKQYDFAFLTYGELCDEIIKYRKFSYFRDMEFNEMAFEGLKALYLPFIARLQILELSHMGGMTRNHLKQLDEDFKSLNKNINDEAARFLKAEFHSRVADVLYYKNSDLEPLNSEKNKKAFSCKACEYYRNALHTLLDKNNISIEKILKKSAELIKDNHNMKFCTIMARTLSDWGNVFFSCDINTNTEKEYKSEENKCFICDKNDYNTVSNKSSDDFLSNCIKYLESEGQETLFPETDQLKNKKDISFAMHSISSIAYRRIGLYKRSSLQMYKMLCLIKDYKIYEKPESKKHIEKLSRQAIHYLWYGNDDLTVLELNKRKKDFGKTSINKDDIIPLQNQLVDTDITRIRVLVKELELKSDLYNTPKESIDLKKYYDLHITSPYKINYSIVGRIYRLRLKTKLNYETYQQILKKAGIQKNTQKEDFVPDDNDFEAILKNEDAEEIFKGEFDIIQIFENLIAETIYCLMDVAQLLETMDETYLFPHSFIAAIHEHLSFWIRQYEAYENYKKENPLVIKNSRIEKYLEQYLDEEWMEQLSGYRENQLALSHYYKCLEMHREGRAYHNMIDIMCYVMDSYNDRSDHFNIAEERHLVVNGEIKGRIDKLKKIYENSKLYDVDNYFKV
jgi:hypothetical protein